MTLSPLVGDQPGGRSPLPETAVGSTATLWLAGVAAEFTPIPRHNAPMVQSLSAWGCQSRRLFSGPCGR